MSLDHGPEFEKHLAAACRRWCVKIFLVCTACNLAFAALAWLCWRLFVCERQ